MTDSTRDKAREQTESAVDSNQDPKEKPHGMPLTLASGGYGGDPCTGPEAERDGECPEGKPADRQGD